MNLSAPNVQMIASRMKRTQRSASNAAAQKARDIRASGIDIIDLTTGEPDFETPRNIKQAAIEAILRGETHYTNVDGTPELKDAVREKFSRDNNIIYQPNQIIVSNGAKQIIYNAFAVTLEDSDEVIIPTPCWVSYPDMARLWGATPVAILCDETQGFKLSAERLRSHITPRTKWLVLNSPSNPTGAVYTRDELLSLANVLSEFPHVYIMMDDIYEHLIYTAEPFVTMAEVAPWIANRVLTINGVSKAYAMTGWRIGYAGGPVDIVSEMVKLQSQSTSNPCSISQAAAVEALRGPQDVVSAYREEYRVRRDIVISALNSIEGISCVKPDGAFYAFVSCQEFIGRQLPSGEHIESDVVFSSGLLSAGVGNIAGTAYGCPGFFRLSTAASQSDLERACGILEGYCRAISGK